MHKQFMSLTNDDRFHQLLANRKQCVHHCAFSGYHLAAHWPMGLPHFELEVLGQPHILQSNEKPIE